jgi:hypothetical protein
MRVGDEADFSVKEAVGDMRAQIRVESRRRKTVAASG